MELSLGVLFLQEGWRSRALGCVCPSVIVCLSALVLLGVEMAQSGLNLSLESCGRQAGGCFLVSRSSHLHPSLCLQGPGELYLRWVRR